MYENTKVQIFMRKDNLFNKAIIILISSFPLQFITGPLLPDITASCCALYFLFYSLTNKLYKYYYNYFFFILFLFYIYILSLSLLSENIYLSLSSSLFYFRYILFSLLIWHVIEKDTKFFFKSLFYILVFLSFFLVVDSFLQFITNYNLLGFYKMEQHRLSGIFRDEYILGSFLIKILPLLIAVTIYNNFFHKKYNLLFSIFLSLYFSLILISGERSALFLAILLLFAYFLFSKQFRYIIPSTILIALIIILISIYYNPLVYERVFTATLGSFISNNQIKIISYIHQDIYLTSFNIFKENMLFGIGPKMFRELCGLNIYAIGDFACSTHPHNYYLQILTETGIIGFIIFFIFLIFVLKDSYSISFNNAINSNKLFNFSIFCSILINLWPLIPTGSFFNNKNSLFIYFSFGIFLYVTNYYKNNVNTKNEF